MEVYTAGRKVCGVAAARYKGAWKDGTPWKLCLYVDETDAVQARTNAEWETVTAEWEEMEPAKPVEPVKFCRSTKPRGNALEIER
jgi:hypothetical protein